MIVNDGNGKLSESSYINVASNDLKINPTNDVVIQSKVLYYDTDKKTSKRVITLISSNDTVTDIFTLNTLPNTCSYVNFELIANNNTDKKSGSYSGLIKINQGDVNTSPVVSDIINYITILDSEMINTEVNKTVSNNMMKINVKGVDTKTINWRMIIKILSE